MKDVKYTLKAIVKHSEGTKAVWKSWLRRLWRPYVLLALSSAVCAYAFVAIACDTLLPVYIYGRSVGNFSHVLGIVGFNAIWLTVFVITLALAIFASIKAHKAMRRVVGKYEKRELGRNRKNLLIVENCFIVCGTMLVAGIPVLTLFLSALAAARSGMLVEKVATPTWVTVAFIGCAVMGMLLLEEVLTFARLTFREISPITTPSTEVNIEKNETENNTDGALAAGSNIGDGIATTAQND